VKNRGNLKDRGEIEQEQRKYEDIIGNLQPGKRKI